MGEPSILDVRLAEIDRRLRTIQTGLRPAERGPGVRAATAEVSTEQVADATAAAERLAPSQRPERMPSLEPLPPPVPLRTVAAVAAGSAGSTEDEQPAERLVDDLRELSAAHERLLELHRELLSSHAELLTLSGAGEHSARAPGAVSIAVGPFDSSAAVRAFERALGTLPGVASVAVREYRDGDRVVVDVELAAV